MPPVKRLAVVLGAACVSAFDLLSFRRLPAAARAKSKQPRKFAERLVRLGPLYVKIGQILSTRPDVLPNEYVAALQGLQEHVPAMPFEHVETIVAEEFRPKRMRDVFATFDKTPKASASVAQVHFATLYSGETVAVKVQRQGIETRIALDLAAVDALICIAKLAAPRFAAAYNLKDGFAEFRRYTLQELDFTIEARTMATFRENFADWHDVRIPEPFPAFVTKRVLTMERVAGQRVDAIARTLTTPQRNKLGRRLLEIEMKMFIGDGLFHADLHPGNILFGPDGTIVLLDFGMYGRLTDEHRDHFMLYWFYGLQGRTKLAFRHLVAQTQRRRNADEDGYYARFRTLANRFYGSTITKYSITQTYLDIITAGAKYGFVFPSDLLLQAKALTTAEALAFVLTPDLRFQDEAQPVIAREFAQRVADPGRIRRRLEDALPELLLLGQLPAAASAPDDGDEVVAARLWSSVGKAFFEHVRAVKPATAVFRGLIDPIAGRILAERFADAGPTMLDRIWADAAERWTTLTAQSTLGATITVHLAAVTAASYDALVAHGASVDDATGTVHDIAWALYQKMGSAAWFVTGACSNDDAERLRLATEAFRTFPFSSPSYGFETVPSPAGVVGFDCVRCPVADYFKTQDRSDLCVRTWCALDFPLAAEVWHGRLERSGSIAGGAGRCDFRWHAETPVANSDAPADTAVPT